MSTEVTTEYVTVVSTAEAGLSTGAVVQCNALCIPGNFFFSTTSYLGFATSVKLNASPAYLGVYNARTRQLISTSNSIINYPKDTVNNCYPFAYVLSTPIEYEDVKSEPGIIVAFYDRMPPDVYSEESLNFPVALRMGPVLGEAGTCAWAKVTGAGNASTVVMGIGGILQLENVDNIIGASATSGISIQGPTADGQVIDFTVPWRPLNLKNDEDRPGVNPKLYWSVADKDDWVEYYGPDVNSITTYTQPYSPCGYPGIFVQKFSSNSSYVCGANGCTSIPQEPITSITEITDGGLLWQRGCNPRIAAYKDPATGDLSKTCMELELLNEPDFAGDPTKPKNIFPELYTRKEVSLGMSALKDGMLFGSLNSEFPPYAAGNVVAQRFTYDGLSVPGMTLSTGPDGTGTVRTSTDKSLLNYTGGVDPSLTNAEALRAIIEGDTSVQFSIIGSTDYGRPEGKCFTINYGPGEDGDEYKLVTAMDSNPGLHAQEVEVNVQSASPIPGKTIAESFGIRATTYNSAKGKELRILYDGHLSENSTYTTLNLRIGDMWKPVVVEGDVSIVDAGAEYRDSLLPYMFIALSGDTSSSAGQLEMFDVTGEFPVPGLSKSDFTGHYVNFEAGQPVATFDSSGITKFLSTNGAAVATNSIAEATAWQQVTTKKMRNLYSDQGWIELLSFKMPDYWVWADYDCTPDDHTYKLCGRSVNGAMEWQFGNLVVGAPKVSGGSNTIKKYEYDPETGTFKVVIIDKTTGEIISTGDSSGASATGERTSASVTLEPTAIGLFGFTVGEEKYSAELLDVEAGTEIAAVRATLNVALPYPLPRIAFSFDNSTKTFELDTPKYNPDTDDFFTWCRGVLEQLADLITEYYVRLTPDYRYKAEVPTPTADDEEPRLLITVPTYYSGKSGNTCKFNNKEDSGRLIVQVGGRKDTLYAGKSVNFAGGVDSYVYEGKAACLTSLADTITNTSEVIKATVTNEQDVVKMKLTAKHPGADGNSLYVTMLGSMSVRWTNSDGSGEVSQNDKVYLSGGRGPADSTILENLNKGNVNFLIDAVSSKAAAGMEPILRWAGKELSEKNMLINGKLRASCEPVYIGTFSISGGYILNVCDSKFVRPQVSPVWFLFAAIKDNLLNMVAIEHRIEIGDPNGDTVSTEYITDPHKLYGEPARVWGAPYRKTPPANYDLFEIWKYTTFNTPTEDMVEYMEDPGAGYLPGYYFIGNDTAAKEGSRYRVPDALMAAKSYITPSPTWMAAHSIIQDNVPVETFELGAFDVTKQFSVLPIRSMGSRAFVDNTAARGYRWQRVGNTWEYLSYGDSNYVASIADSPYPGKAVSCSAFMPLGFRYGKQAIGLTNYRYNMSVSGRCVRFDDPVLTISGREASFVEDGQYIITSKSEPTYSTEAFQAIDSMTGENKVGDVVVDVGVPETIAVGSGAMFVYDSFDESFNLNNVEAPTGDVGAGTIVITNAASAACIAYYEDISLQDSSSGSTRVSSVTEFTFGLGPINRNTDSVYPATSTSGYAGDLVLQYKFRLGASFSATIVTDISDFSNIIFDNAEMYVHNRGTYLGTVRVPVESQGLISVGINTTEDGMAPEKLTQASPANLNISRLILEEADPLEPGSIAFANTAYAEVTLPEVIGSGDLYFQKGDPGMPDNGTVATYKIGNIDEFTGNVYIGGSARNVAFRSTLSDDSVIDMTARTWESTPSGVYLGVSTRVVGNSGGFRANKIQMNNGSTVSAGVRMEATTVSVNDGSTFEGTFSVGSNTLNDGVINCARLVVAGLFRNGTDAINATSLTATTAEVYCTVTNRNATMTIDTLEYKPMCIAANYGGFSSPILNSGDTLVLTNIYDATTVEVKSTAASNYRYIIRNEAGTLTVNNVADFYLNPDDDGTRVPVYTAEDGSYLFGIRVLDDMTVDVDGCGSGNVTLKGIPSPDDFTDSYGLAPAQITSYKPVETWFNSDIPSGGAMEGYYLEEYTGSSGELDSGVICGGGGGTTPPEEEPDCCKSSGGSSGGTSSRTRASSEDDEDDSSDDEEEADPCADVECPEPEAPDGGDGGGGGGGGGGGSTDDDDDDQGGNTGNSRCNRCSSTVNVYQYQAGDGISVRSIPYDKWDETTRQCDAMESVGLASMCKKYEIGFQAVTTTVKVAYTFAGTATVTPSSAQYTGPNCEDKLAMYYGLELKEFTHGQGSGGNGITYTHNVSIRCRYASSLNPNPDGQSSVSFSRYDPGTAHTIGVKVQWSSKAATLNWNEYSVPAGCVATANKPFCISRNLKDGSQVCFNKQIVTLRKHEYFNVQLKNYLSSNVSIAAQAIRKSGPATFVATHKAGWIGVSPVQPSIPPRVTYESTPSLKFVDPRPPAFPITPPTYITITRANPLPEIVMVYAAGPDGLAAHWMFCEYKYIGEAYSTAYAEFTEDTAEYNLLPKGGYVNK